MLNQFFFIAFPYAALSLAVLVGIYRFIFDRYSYSSYSSQFLEKGKLFWGSVHFHYGIVFVLTAHLLAALFPGLWRNLLGNQVRLYFLEITGFVLGLFVLGGLLLLIFRRTSDARIKVVTSKMDWLLLVVLLLQAFSGVFIAMKYRWGGLWYTDTAVPWLWSLFSFNPKIVFITSLPWMARFHIVNAFVITALFPFTRLVHFVSIPFSYLWRPLQVVIWNKTRSEYR